MGLRDRTPASDDTESAELKLARAEAKVGRGTRLEHAGAPAVEHRGGLDHRHSGMTGLDLRGDTHVHHGGSATLEHRSDSHLHHDGTTGLELKGSAQVRHDGNVALHHGGATTLGLAGAAGIQLGNAEGRPLAAAVQLLLGGGNEPVKLGPLSLDIGRVQLQPDLELRFKLFGKYTLFTVNLRGTTRLGPDDR